MAKSYNIMFVGDLLVNQSDNESYEIYSNMILRKATDIECRFIREDLKSYFANSYFQKDFNPYENSQIKIVEKKKIYTEIKPLEKEKWHYWVIENRTNKIGGIEDYITLSKSDIQIICGYGYFIDKTEPNVYAKIEKNNVNMSVFYSNLKYYDYAPKDISNLIIDNIKATFSLVEEFSKNDSDKYPIVNKSLQDFLKLGQIPANNPFKVLNYFSILEFLITSKNENSITYQLKSKINLINNRLDEKINIAEYFKDAPNLDTLISKLYSLRSDIAHGSFKDFEEFKIIPKGNPIITIPAFIYNELLKKILTHALKEPNLFQDLKKC